MGVRCVWVHLYGGGAHPCGPVREGCEGAINPWRLWVYNKFMRGLLPPAVSSGVLRTLFSLEILLEQLLARKATWNTLWSPPVPSCPLCPGRGKMGIFHYFRELCAGAGNAGEGRDRGVCASECKHNKSRDFGCSLFQGCCTRQRFVPSSHVFRAQNDRIWPILKLKMSRVQWSWLNFWFSFHFHFSNGWGHSWDVSPKVTELLQPCNSGMLYYH